MLGWLLKWLNLITAHGSVSNEPGSVTWIATKNFENCQLEKLHWKINHIVTTEYIILAKINIPSSYFTISMLNCLEDTPKLQFDSYVMSSCQILDLINFQNNLPWPNSNTAGISLDSRLIYSKIAHRYSKDSPSLASCAENFPLIQISSILSVNFTSLWHKCQRVFWWASCTSARHAESFDCLTTSLILITMDNGRGHCAYRQSCKVINQNPTEE